MTTTAPHRHALRRDTIANWTAKNPVLASGEEVLEKQADGSWLRKVGDGSTAYTSLGYADRGPAGTDGTDGAPGSSDLTFSDNGDGTGTISWNAGANSVKFALVSGGLIAAGVLPAVSVTTVTTVADQTAMLALDAQQGDVAVRADNSTVYMLGTNGDPTVLADWIPISQPGAVASVAGKTGIVVLVANDISDATTTGKAVMTAANQANARTALGLGTSATVDTGTTSGTVPVLNASGQLDMARLASGTPNGTKFVRDDGTLATPGGGGTPTWTTPTITSTTTFSGAGAVRYTKDSQGWVHIEGGFQATASISSGTTLFTLASGYRPASGVGFAALYYDNGSSSFKNGGFQVTSTGDVIWRAGASMASSSQAFLSGSFYVGP